MSLDKNNQYPGEGDDPQDRNRSGDVKPTTDQTLRIEEGDTVTLSPNSRMFGQLYRQVRPRSIDEVRKLLGPSAAPSYHLASCNCRAPELASNLISVADLESEDRAVAVRARELAHLAAREYVRGDHTTLTHWKPVLNRYLEITKSVINILTLADIEVHDRATLNISSTTHALFANRVMLFGTGSISCKGPTTFRVSSFEGKIRLRLSPASSIDVPRLPIS
jgi:hypothetical protein